MARRTLKGPTVRRQYACPCCGHSQWGASSMKARPVAYRDVRFAGAGNIGVVREVYVDELDDARGDLGEYVATVKQVVARLAEVLGLVLEHETVKQVVREVVKKVYVHRARKRIKKVAAMATAFVRTPAGRGKRRGRPQRTRGTRSLQSFVQERWDPTEFVSAGGTDGGKVHEEW